jgi:hypothetical protein
MNDDTPNEDITQEIAMTRKDYVMLRYFVQRAVEKRIAICKEIGFDDDETIAQLRELIAIYAEEERMLVAMLKEGDVVDDPMLALREAQTPQAGDLGASA